MAEGKCLRTAMATVASEIPKNFLKIKSGIPFCIFQIRNFKDQVKDENYEYNFLCKEGNGDTYPKMANK